MRQDSVILTKSLHFAAGIVKLYRYLTKEKHEIVISKQIVRSGTNIGANANCLYYQIICPLMMDNLLLTIVLKSSGSWLQR